MKQIVVIGLDTAEYSLIEKWGQEGLLPNLSRLIREGAFGLMESYATHLPGANWFSFYLSQQPGVHGLYSHFSWRAEKMRVEIPSPSWIETTPFWHRFQEHGPRGLVINVPDTFMLTSFNGIELLSLASDYMLTMPLSNPKHYSKKIQRELQRIFYHEEKYDLLSLKEFLQTRDEMIELTRALTDLAIKMMREETWDAFVTVFPAVHRAGHRLWSTINIRDLATQLEEEEASNALKQVYIETDAAIGKLIRNITDQDTVLVFSTHGMTHNHSREAVLPEMLYRILNPESWRKRKSSGLLKKLRNRVPLSWRHRVKSLLPLFIRQHLSLFWRVGQLDWSTTSAFVIPLEVRIGIRINLKGREVRGIVEPGAEYDNLCKRIIAELKTFVDADTGQPLIKDLVQANEVFAGERLNWLPDVVGSWADDSSSNHRVITSPLYGDIPWPTPGHNPEGRSGNHNDTGFLVAHGKGIKPGKIKDAHILDLAPTILAILGQSIPADMQGRVLPILDGEKNVS